MGKKDIESTLNEVRILCSVENEYVVGYKDAFLDKNDTELCIGSDHLNSEFCTFKIGANRSHGIRRRRRPFGQGPRAQAQALALQRGYHLELLCADPAGPQVPARHQNHAPRHQNCEHLPQRRLPHGQAGRHERRQGRQKRLRVHANRNALLPGAGNLEQPAVRLPLRRLQFGLREYGLLPQ